MKKKVYYVRIIEEIRFNIIAEDEEQAQEFIQTHSISDIAAMTDDYTTEDDEEIIETIYGDVEYAIDITEETD